jgi:hypothetical protein
MSIGPTFQTHLQFEHHSRKRRELEDFGLAHVGQKFSSYWLHVRFGQGVRSRISEINRDNRSPILFANTCFFDREHDEEISGYEVKLRQEHCDNG